MTGGAHVEWREIRAQVLQIPRRAGRTEGDDDEAEEEVRKPEFELHECTRVQRSFADRLPHRASARGETRTWLSPCTLVTMAAPRPVVTLTLMPPIMLQTMMYHSMLFVPYLGISGQTGRANA